MDVTPIGNMKSQVEDDVLHMCVQIISDLYDTLAACYDQRPSCPFSLIREEELDIRTFKRRFGAEGLGYATKQLPKLGKALDAYLGAKEPCFEGFAPFELGFPKFLRSFWLLIREYPYDEVHSTELAQAIACARTLFYGFYKLEVPFTPEQVKEKTAVFIQTDNECEDFELPYDNRVTEMASHAVSAALEGFTYRDGLTQVDLTPKHGPGAVATGEKDEEKWVFAHKYLSLHSRFPYYSYQYGTRSNGRPTHVLERRKAYRAMAVLDTPTAKLVFVPKDSRGPRIISSEPSALQFMQQAVATKLVSHIERSPVTAGHVNFADQSMNARLALVSSRTKEFATLDLSEASDRVSITLVDRLVDDREFFKDLMALRSYATRLPSGEVRKLHKYAPMGSALCFPIESLLFWGLCVAAIQVTGRTFADARDVVYVYGDDIIVPTEYYDVVVAALESHGLSVNGSKSFNSGSFRESCGCDAWQGHDVTPQRFRKFPPLRSTDGSACFAWAAYASELLARGMTRSYRHARSLVERVLGRIPTTSSPVGFLSIVDPKRPDELNEFRKVRWDPELCYPTAEVYVLRQKRRPLQLDSWERLLMNLTGSWAERDPSVVVARDATQMSKRRTPLTEYSIFDWISMASRP